MDEHHAFDSQGSINDRVPEVLHVGTGAVEMGCGGACAVRVPCLQHPKVGGTDSQLPFGK